MQRFLESVNRLLLTLWVGCLWAVGYLAVPVLFANVDSKTAGMLAGHMFTPVSYIGMACGAVLLVLRGFRCRWRGGDWKLWVLAGMLALVLVGEWVLQPMMADLKGQGLAEGSRQAAAFGRLHGIAAVLYLIESLAGAVLVATGLEGPKRRAPSIGAG